MSEIWNIHINDFSEYRLTGDPRISPAETARQVACYRKLFSPLGSNSAVADVACGDGRQTLPLARVYEKVVGFDNDEQQMHRARERSAEFDNVKFVRADMRKELPVSSGTFDGVLSGFSSWGFYGPKGDQQSLHQMSCLLKPGGVFVLDYGNVEARLREIREHGVWTENLQQRVKLDTLYDPHGQEVTRTSWIDADGWYHWICQRVGSPNPLLIGSQKGYYPDELKDMLRQAGLEPTAMYGGYNLEPVNDTNVRLIVRAEKL